MQRPAGVTAIAAIVLLAAVYLLAVGLIMLLSPGSVSLALGAPLLGGLETAGPYMFLLMGPFAALVGWGLLRLNNWARRVAIIVAMIGGVLLVPSVSAAVAGVHTAALMRGGLGIVVRVAVVWYLYQTPVAERFTRNA